MASEVKFDNGTFKSKLQTKFLGQQVCYEQQVESTMDTMEEMISKDAVPGTLCLAEEQTKGRGRQNRPWASARGNNLYFSMYLQFSDVYDVFKLNFAVPLAVVLAAKDEAKVTAMVKWPNDVWVGGKKLSGMLLNSSVQGTSFQVNCGVGINVNEDMKESKDEEVRAVATSLRSESGSLVNREALLASFCNHLEALLARDMSQVLTLYQQHDLLCGKQVVVMPKKREHTESWYTATALGFSPQGNLRVRTAEGTEIELVSEEVTIRPEELNTDNSASKQSNSS